MDSQIAAKYYFDTDIFEQEQKAIFRKTWIFAAFVHDLNKDNDFVTLTIDEVPIVVQRLKGTIKAFLNVCSHRFSILQREERGNRPLQCPYHGWTYSHEGIPSGIPNRPLFKNYSKDELCDMRLREFDVSICGSLVFVRMLADGVGLKEYLGSYYDEIEALTNAFGKRVDINPMTINANWKVVIENTLEGYHLPLVHKNTLDNLMSRSYDDQKMDFSAPPHSYGTFTLLIKEDSKKLYWVHKPFQNRSWKLNGYIHYHIFPTLLISTSYGTSFNVNVIRPVGAETTHFTSHVFLSKLDEGYTDEDVKTFSENTSAYNRVVFAEDEEACESVQKGVKHTSQQGVLSLEEQRVGFFQKQYMDLLHGNETLKVK